MEVAFGVPYSRRRMCDGVVFAMFFVSFGQTWGPKETSEEILGVVAGRGHIDWSYCNNMAG